MTRTHFHGPGEHPGDLDGCCLICLMVARGAELDALEADWKALEADGLDGEQKWFLWEARTLIRSAVVEGISDVLPPGSPLVPLCWDHLAGLMIPRKQESRLFRNAGPPPPGLRRGRN